ncbi:MAG: hypothetical protein KA821_16210 [Chitinophagaceae bacterium]|nr:hypothetical protein [Chitinophagaceae bacterium]
MTSATISISKKITMIKSNNGTSVVTMHNLSDLASVVNGLDVFTMYGTSKPAKFEKYFAVVLAAGYIVSQVNWNTNAGFEGENADVINYSYIFTKQ